MSVVSHEGETVDKLPACPGCAERDAELRRLRLELASRRQQDADRRGFQWWCILIFGLAVFLVMPFAVYLLSVSFTDQSDIEWINVIFHAVLWCVPLSQCCLVALVVALHWRPRWQRMGVGVASLFLFVSVASLPFLASNEETYQDLILLAVPLLPMTVAVSVLPVFVQRALHRWTITSRQDLTQPRPVTLSSYFVLVSLFGLASGVLKLSDWSEDDFTTVAEAFGGFLIYFGVPALSIGGLFSVLLPAILQRTGQRFLTWARRLIGIGVASAAGPLLLGVAILALDGESLSWSVVAYLLSYCLAITVGTFLVAATSIIWLRLLDYRLISVPRRDTQTLFF